MTAADEKRKIQLLLIEDNEDDVVIFKDILAGVTSCTFTVQAADSLRRGREILSSDPADLVFCDLSLPDNHDISGIQKLQADYPHIPIVILTANKDEKKAFRAIRFGAEDYLCKNSITTDLIERSILFAIERKKIIVELNQANAKLQGMVGQDPLTGVLNRRGLQDVLEMASLQMQRSNMPVYALLLDFDDFKKINDQHSFRIGDLVLVEICQRIREVVRNSDYVARIGGDEFLILLMDTREAEGQLVADKIRMKIAQLIFMTDLDKEVKATVSIGGSPLEEDVRLFDQFLQKLHRALKTSKELGKNTATHWQKKGSYAENRASKQQELSEQIFETGRLYVVQQAVYDLKTRQIAGYELLSRMDSIDLSMPDDFFVFARQVNLLTGVDIRCFRECLKAISRLPGNPGHVHLNLFPSTLLEVGWRGILKECQAVDLSLLCLELSEQQIIGNPMTLAPDIQQLQSHGIRIAIDDVGFGRTSLESLVVLRPDLVKIDKSCVIGIGKSELKKNNFERLLRIVEACVPHYVIEGIETEEELAFVLRSGCTYGQGYLFAKPERF